jgi:hypothetical protein
VCVFQPIFQHPEKKKNYMLRRCFTFRRHTLQNPPDYERVVKRRRQLEERRQKESAFYLPPVEPTPEQARTLYRQMLKKGYKDLVLTDKQYYRKVLRTEFEETARQTSGRVRGVMYEKGKWMLQNNLGGVL